MDFMRGVTRNQVILFPETVEDYITEDNPVRFIDVFAGSLDLEKLGFTRVKPADTGRPAYDPVDLLRLYIYGYLNRVRSSRLLEREAKVNVEVMWLLGKLRPDFKTIADFRRDNREAIKGVCREFTLVCKKLELFGGELVAIDGSKFKAVNNRRRNFSEARLTKAIKAIEEKISTYLGSLDQQDAAETEPMAAPVLSAEELGEKISLLQERREVPGSETGTKGERGEASLFDRRGRAGDGDASQRYRRLLQRADCRGLKAPVDRRARSDQRSHRPRASGGDGAASRRDTGS